MATSLRVLVLDDRSADAELMIAELRRSAFDVEWERAETENQYLAGLERAPVSFWQTTACPNLME